MKKKIEFKAEREASPYDFLDRTAQEMLLVFEERKEKKESGWRMYLVSALIFSAFKFEAYLNHIGQKAFVQKEKWDAYEKKSTLKKYDELATHLKLQVDKESRPYTTVQKLFSFRNALAHGKTKIDRIENELSREEYEAMDRNFHRDSFFPELPWEIDLSFIENIKDIDEALKQLYEKIGVDWDPSYSPHTSYSFREKD